MTRRDGGKNIPIRFVFIQNRESRLGVIPKKMFRQLYIKIKYFSHHNNIIQLRMRVWLSKI